MKIPGKNNRYGDVNIYFCAADKRAPHSGEGGWIPMPIKLKPAADKIIPEIPIVVLTIIGPIALGSTYRKMILKFEVPYDFAARI